MRLLPSGLLLLAALACGPDVPPQPTRQTECPSPDGRWVAATYLVGRGGAAGSVTLYVALRPRGDTLAVGSGDVLALRYGQVERLVWHPASRQLLVSLDTSVVVEDAASSWEQDAARVTIETVRRAIPATRRWAPATCAVGAT